MPVWEGRSAGTRERCFYSSKSLVGADCVYCLSTVITCVCGEFLGDEGIRLASEWIELGVNAI